MMNGGQWLWGNRPCGGSLLPANTDIITTSHTHTHRGLFTVRPV